jgi:hypothetical protein
VTPHHHHATRLAWALHTALGRLRELTALEARQRVDEHLAAADGLRSPLYGVRHATGDHADPVSGTLTLPDATGRVIRWADLWQRATDRLEWIAGQIGPASGWTVGLMTASGHYDVLFRIHIGIPRLSPSTAAVLARHLADEDRWIRDAVRMPPAGQPLAGVPCPRCDTRQLTVHTDGPQDAWTVTCTCVCVGQGCRCQMPGAVEGVQHIWPRSTVLTSTDKGESDRG